MPSWQTSTCSASPQRAALTTTPPGSTPTSSPAAKPRCWSWCHHSHYPAYVPSLEATSTVLAPLFINGQRWWWPNAVAEVRLLLTNPPASEQDQRRAEDPTTSAARHDAVPTTRRRCRLDRRTAVSGAGHPADAPRRHARQWLRLESGRREVATLDAETDDDTETTPGSLYR